MQISQGQRPAMKKILVTGGSGFLGRNLIERLRRDGHTVTCFDRWRAPFLEACGATFIEGDMARPHALADAVPGHDAIVHMACSVVPKSSTEDPYFDVVSNIGGAVNLLEAMRTHQVKRVVFISSGGTVYGRPNSIPIQETSPTNPDCSYGVTKLAIEKYMRLYTQLYGLSTCSLRVANPYGEYQRVRATQGAIPVFCYKALKGEPISIWGDGSISRDFLYVGDTVDAILAALERPNVTGEINIGSGKAHSLNDILQAIEQVLGHPIARSYTDSRSFDVPINVLDVTQAKLQLDWAPKVSLEEGLLRTIQWIRNSEGL